MELELAAGRKHSTIHNSSSSQPPPISFLLSPPLPLPSPYAGQNYQDSSLQIPPFALALFLSSSVTFSARPPPQEDEWDLSGHSNPWSSSSRSPPPAVSAATSPNPIPGPVLPHLSHAHPGLVPSSAHLQPIRTRLVLSHSDPQPRHYLQSITAQHVSRTSRRARRR